MARVPAEDRLGRLLAIVPWIAAHEGPTLAEVGQRFSVGEKELVEDLELLFLCGVHPFTPDVLIDVDIADGRVWIRMADYFRRPLRLSPQEGLALVSAGSALLAVPGADPEGALATALAKLETVLGVGAEGRVEVELGPAAPGVLDSVRRAADTGRQLDIDYYSFGRDGFGRRVVHPWRLFNAEGHWYLRGWCGSAVGERLFRVDRISRAEVLDEPADPPPGPGGRAGGGDRSSPDRAAGPGRGPGGGPVSDEIYQPSPDDPVFVLDLEPEVHWIADVYPNDGAEVILPSGPDAIGADPARAILRVTLRSGQRAWMERLLLRAGPHARLVEGDPSVGPAAAARLLTRYLR